jgi:hypothetical protein
MKNIDKKLFLREISELIDSLEAHGKMSGMRLDFLRRGETGKAKYIERQILPHTDKKIAIQNERVIALLQSNNNE